MKKYIYRVQKNSCPFIKYTNYKRWSKERYVFAESRKNAMQLIFERESTKQIKLVTCLKMNPYDVVIEFIENTTINNNNPSISVMDKWNKIHHRKGYSNLKRFVKTYKHRFDEQIVKFVEK